MSILSALRGRASGAESAAAACWACSGGTGPMCAWCTRQVRDTATREAGARYAAAGDERVEWLR